jgi:hypothetical protein
MTRRDEPEIPFTGRSWDEPPRRRRTVPTDPAVTTIDGRGFRRESSIVVLDTRITTDDRANIAQRSAEAAEARRADADSRFRRALELGETLRALREG